MNDAWIQECNGRAQVTAGSASDRTRHSMNALRKRRRIVVRKAQSHEMREPIAVHESRARMKGDALFSGNRLQL